MSNANEVAFQKAKKVIPGGVNSPVRAFGSVGGTPRTIDRGAGSKIYDVTGKEFLDYVGSWGPLILGHAHPDIVRVVQQTAERGLSFGAPTEKEIELAEIITRLVPSMEQVRLVSSGTEATMSAIRLARGFTGKPKIIKFEGCYHGHSDSLLVKAGSGALTFGQPSSAGVPSELTSHTIVLDYNNVEMLNRAFSEAGDEIAGVIIEPIAGNMNLVKASPDFVSALRNLCDRYGALLIYDEVMTGFRVGISGAQGIQGVTPDITTLGKVIGGGMPMGAFGARREIMDKLAPLGPVYQAGTLSGNPVSVAAGIRTLQLIQEPEFFDDLTKVTRRLVDGMTETAKKHSVDFCADSVGGMFGMYFSRSIPESFSDVMTSDRERFNQFFHLMLDRGVYLAPSAFEAGFVSSAHSEADIAATLDAADEAFAKL